MPRPLEEFSNCPAACKSTATPIAPPLAFVNPLVEASTPIEEAPAVEDQAFPEAPQASQSIQAYVDCLVLAFNYFEGGEEPLPVEEDSQDSEINDSEDFDTVALLAAYEAYIQQIEDRHTILAATQTVVPVIASRASSQPRISSLEVASSTLQEEQECKISKLPAPDRPPFEYTGNPEESDAESDTTIHDESDTPQSAKARSKAPATPQKAQKASADSPIMPPRRGYNGGPF
ncbi:uncharacterized protein H6S33_003775 [Morchella sextelata]|uniref:uncharacterized protein n=1 Tax=Morchella sextelata TaxID=1174677 RepID=UPI001D038F05|nr:uncharacterized protein H6S33_003775 [Morchella sextelata]KAH0606114.1 hypothetical protein H6S33_003775 [Morchella sextelata]